MASQTPSGKLRNVWHRPRCVKCNRLIVGPLYAFNNPCSYACASCLRHWYEEQDNERWSAPEEFESFFESELRNRQEWAEENWARCRRRIA
jgi:hypothetical protein